MEAVEDVVIVGAGIAGLATAVALKRVGVRALVLERTKELRATGAALTLFPNALIALNALGCSDKLTSLYKPCLKGFVTNVVTGVVQDISTGETHRKLTEHRAVHRRALLEALAEELPVDTIRFSCKLSAIETQSNQNTSITTVHMEDGTNIKAKILIGCDGVNSVVANWLGLAKPADSGRSSVRGLARYPQGHGLKLEIRQFLDEGKRGGFVPLNEKELYWFLTFQSPPNDENVAGKPEQIQSKVTENYAKNFPPIFLDVVKHSDLSNLTITPLVFRYPWDITFGTLSKGNVTVAGDAMHPMTPDLGQGGCSALEDAVLLGRYIGESFIKNRRTLVSEDIPQALQGYVNERRWRTACLVGGSYISGWAQQGGSGWLNKLVRVFAYKFLLIRIVKLAYYDCGRLPSVSSVGELESSSKKD